jgi:hypothetical protein
VTSSNVSFLNSGNLLHTIFPKSQCWCVDGESIFVLRIRQDSYYRIEIPHESDDDREKVDQFKTVLRQVLQYEKTRSPFTQASIDEAPERPKTPPVRRRSIRPPEKAKKWVFDKQWKSEDTSRPATPVLAGSDSGTASSYEDDDRSSIADKSDRVEEAPDSPATNLAVTPQKPQPKPSPSVLERTRTFQSTRSFTAPMNMTKPQSPLADAPVPVEDGAEVPYNQSNHTSIREEDEAVEDRKGSIDTQSIMSSTDSFYSLDTHRSPSPCFEDAEDELINPWADFPNMLVPEARGRSTHRRQTSDLTLRAPSSEPSRVIAPVTPTTSGPVTASGAPLSSPPSTPPLVSDSDDDSVRPPSLDVPTPPAALRMKRLTGASQKRAFSPMPQPQNIFRPQARGPAKQFTAASIRKTCEIVLGPPAHLVQLMLRIAANISDGVFSFNTYRVPRNTEKIPCSWESSDDEDEWPEEDDFGIPLRTLDSRDSSTHRRRNFSGEVD